MYKSSLPHLIVVGCWANVDKQLICTVLKLMSYLTVPLQHRAIYFVYETKVKVLCFQSLDGILQRYTLI